VRNRIDLM